MGNQVLMQQKINLGEEIKPIIDYYSHLLQTYITKLQINNNERYYHRNKIFTILSLFLTFFIVLVGIVSPAISSSNGLGTFFLGFGVESTLFGNSSPTGNRSIFFNLSKQSIDSGITIFESNFRLIQGILKGLGLFVLLLSILLIGVFLLDIEAHKGIKKNECIVGRINSILTSLYLLMVRWPDQLGRKEVKEILNQFYLPPNQFDRMLIDLVIKLRSEEGQRNNP